jgi:sulfate permease, SulP family
MHKVREFFHNPKTELLSGLTVSLALVPEAIAFAFIAGVDPLVALYAAFIVGLITSLFGGRKGMISGATGALAVVMTSLVIQHGVEYLFATVVLMGIIQMLCGVLHLGRFIKMVPHPVMLGFVNGLAIVIFLSQLTQFQTLDAAGNSVWLATPSLVIMLAIVALTMAVIYLFPKLTSKFPATLAGILVSSLLVIIFNIDTKTVGDLASISGGLPQFHIPMVDLNFTTLKIILPYAFILAAIGLIESLLTLTLIDDITGTKGKNSRECFVQGSANLVTGFFAGMGGCAMIGQSMINIKSGGRGRLSGVSAAGFLLCFILFAASIIELIPIAALVGVMFVVVIATFEWSSIKMIGRIPLSDFLVIILVSLVTVFTDLAIAVVVGVIVSALVFAWQCAKNIYTETTQSDNKKTYAIHGQIFFASISSFKALFDPSSDPDDVTIDFKYTRLWDHSALEAVEHIAQKYLTEGKTLHLVHLSSHCRGLLDKADNCIEVNTNEDPHYRIAVIESDKF